MSGSSAVLSCCKGCVLFRPRLQDMARQMQENNPSMYQELQQEATRFQQQARQQQQVPADEEAKEEKKEENQ